MVGDGEYWFDISALVVEHEPPSRPALTGFRDQWSQDRSVKGRISSLRNVDAKGLLKDALLPDRRNRIEEFAHANGLEFLNWQQTVQVPRPGTRPGQLRPGLLFGNDANDLVSWPGWPFVEFGNLRLYGGLKWGYVALRHDLRFPHIVIDATANDLEPKGRRPTTTSLTRREGEGSPRSKLDQLKGTVARIDLGPEAARQFNVWGQIGREDDVRRLLAGEPFRTVCETSQAFDIEITDSWIFLYGYEFDVSTTEPERWAWLFSLTSRWIDVVHDWADASGAVANPDAVMQRPPFYTEETVARPRSLAELPRIAGHNTGGGGPLSGLYP